MMFENGAGDQRVPVITRKQGDAQWKEHQKIMITNVEFVLNDEVPGKLWNDKGGPG